MIGVLMIRYESLVSYIEQLRHQKHITLEVFTKDIISERTYRRYLNENQAFTFDVLVKLVHRLDMRMRDVLIYAFNQNSIKHQEEIYFAHYMTLRQIDLAKPYFEKIQHKTLETHLGSIYIPVLMTYYQYPKDYIKFAKEKIDFDHIFESSMINRQTLDVLLFILPDLNEKDFDAVIKFLLRMLDGDVQLLSLQHQVDYSNILHKVLKFMTQSPERVMTYEKSLKSVMMKALEDIIISHLNTNYDSFLESVILYATYNHNNFLRDRFIYYHVAYSFTVLDRPIKHDHLYSKDEGFSIYLKHLKDIPLLINEVIS